MKKLSLGLASIVIALAATPDDATLRKMATDNGIQAIPKSQAQIQALIEKTAPDAKSNKSTKEKIELGKMLYFDPRLSKSNLISCNTCHNLGLGGADLVPAAIGHKWQPNGQHLNSPTVYNSVFNEIQFWDGRAAHLAEQAQGPIQNPVEMAASKELIVERITSIPEYVDAFKKAYGANTKITFELIASTIGVYERTLITPSPFDDFLNGDNNALNKEQKEGLAIFLDKGCATCHTGVNLGGSMQPFAVVKDYQFSSLGGFKGNKDGLVKAPTLRNVAQTAPYFHNGAFWNLTDAIKEMGSIQLGIDIDDTETKKIASFLQSLTGRKPKVEYPMLPDSTAKTPKPEFQ
ncbi:MAG: cytochrome-c peroxidase [Helicobacter sp.]|uniref:cytochrome-c peroxidase n=1 Tax=Helicobacter sp. TaxID=218 RepID=UPI002A7C0BCE|nr:cytochrome-c peroxidase [Helicobacter sp.]MDY2823414.1 cytochrome-c peroxidase [Helicobacter sp.]